MFKWFYLNTQKYLFIVCFQVQFKNKNDCVEALPVEIIEKM